MATRPIAEAVTAALPSIVRAGASAPSGDNCQPWRYRWDGRELSVVFVPERAESLYDVRHAASWISLGAVLANVSVAASAHGLRAVADLFPGDVEPDTVARVRFEPGAPVDPLVTALDHRCVNRSPYRTIAIAAPVRAEMEAIASAIPGRRLGWVEGPLVARAARMAAQNDRLLFENRALHDGLYRWLRWSPAEAARTGDGMPIDTLGLHRAERPGFKLLGAWPAARLMTRLGVTRLLPRRSELVYRRSGAIALLSVEGAERGDFVQGGEAVERIWLTATRHGLGFQPITGVTFLLLRMAWLGGRGIGREHRPILERVSRELHGLFPSAVGRTPIMLFRLGAGAPPVARAPRLPLSRLLQLT